MVLRNFNEYRQIKKHGEKVAIDAKPTNAVRVEGIDETRKKQSSSDILKSPSIRQAPSFLGKQNILVILVSFNNTTIQNSDADWSNRFFRSSKSATDYYNQTSLGKIVLTPAQETYGASNDGIIHVKSTQNHPDTYDMVDGRNVDLVRKTISASDPYVNFAQYDKNNNGKIEANELHIVTIIAGYEAAYDGSYPSVWAHWTTITASPKLDNKTFTSYTQFGEMHDDHMANVGTITHELGHDFGLPDLYDIAADSEDIGALSLMALVLGPLYLQKNLEQHLLILMHIAR